MQASELVELGLSKLEFLEVTKKGLSKLQILLVELEVKLTSIYIEWYLKYDSRVSWMCGDMVYHTVENNYIVMSQGVGCGQDSVYSITSHLSLINDQGGENYI